jgi:ABC-type Fe3+-hydroxamate transport system substrate-binding protein
MRSANWTASSRVHATVLTSCPPSPMGRAQFFPTRGLQIRNRSPVCLRLGNCGSPFQEKALAEILKAGVRFLGLAPRTLTDIYTDIATIAGTVGVSSRGEEVIRSMQQHIEAVRTRTETAKRPRVFCEEWGKPIIASQPWVAELIYGAGGDFAGAPARQYSSDEIAALNPDVIIAAWCGLGIAFRWRKSSPIADGNERQPRSQAASSAFVTSF